MVLFLIFWSCQVLEHQLLFTALEILCCFIPFWVEFAVYSLALQVTFGMKMDIEKKLQQGAFPHGMLRTTPSFFAIFLLGFQNQFCPLVFVTSTVAILE
jgi:hypothetical protein